MKMVLFSAMTLISGLLASGCQTSNAIDVENEDLVNPLLDEWFAEKSTCSSENKMCYQCNCSKYPKKFGKIRLR
jgi:hypothetical protein